MPATMLKLTAESRSHSGLILRFTARPLLTPHFSEVFARHETLKRLGECAPATTPN